MKSYAWLMTLLLSAFALAETFWLDAFSGLNHRAQDNLLRRHALSRTPDPEVVLINIDERSLEAMNPEFGRHPWPRSVFGQLTENLARHGARAIVWDVNFADPDRGREDQDNYLIEAGQNTPQAFFPMLRLDPEADGDPESLKLDAYAEKLGLIRTPAAVEGARIALLLPFTKLAETGRIGSINFLRDDDGVGRRYHVYIEKDGWRIPSLPARVATALGFWLPDQPDIEINWRGRPDDRVQFSYTDIFRDYERETPEKYGDAVRGKIVVIGAAAPSLGDLRATPMDSLHPGADILASAIETLKNGDGLQRPPPWVEAALAVGGVLLVAGLFALGLNPLACAVALAGLTPAYIWGAYSFLPRGLIMPLFTPLAFAWLAFLARSIREFLSERAAKQDTVRAFSRFVNPTVVADLLKKGGDLSQMKGQSREISILFSDIRGFTSLSETRQPQEVVDILNRYFTRQVEVIFRHKGTMDKFIGDAIMAFWGAPLNDPDHARNAVNAALEMAEVMLDFRKELPGELAHEFDIGIGIHTGPAVVGFIGSVNKLDYTAIGDSVNLASRIEGATKGVARVLVSEATRDACGEFFSFADRGSFKAKGREQEVRLYEPGAQSHA